MTVYLTPGELIDPCPAPAPTVCMSSPCRPLPDAPGTARLAHRHGVPRHPGAGHEYPRDRRTPAGRPTCRPRHRPGRRRDRRKPRSAAAAAAGRDRRARDRPAARRAHRHRPLLGPAHPPPAPPDATTAALHPPRHRHRPTDRPRLRSPGPAGRRRADTDLGPALHRHRRDPASQHWAASPAESCRTWFVASTRPTESSPTPPPRPATANSSMTSRPSLSRLRWPTTPSTGRFSCRRPRPATGRAAVDGSLPRQHRAGGSCSAGHLDRGQRPPPRRPPPHRLRPRPRPRSARRRDRRIAVPAPRRRRGRRTAAGRDRRQGRRRALLADADTQPGHGVLRIATSSATLRPCLSRRATTARRFD
ncbi:hypothetical protein SAMN04489730_6493 [Amycolatopsis australiensis]|uniref:Uncharacterized protein n=1 Tax=Amycolatopsis australiensis TaxID=546364 RepID=A0A1K1SQZ8_9PSEU|nr:hypothetical protein SAMN04489730_6493 [Amycolatopsis australiensis]